MKNKTIISIIIVLLILVSFIVFDENEIVFDFADDIQYQFEYKSDFIEPVVKAYYQKKFSNLLKLVLILKKLEK
ncbi:MAG: hypothetical protein GX935_04790 [Erysipelotrichia bacterium]|nr:hypothetical protein [Erysipelotrichia bacterium]